MRALSYGDFLPLYTRNACRYVVRHLGTATGIGVRGVLLLGTLLRLAILPFVTGDHGRREAAHAYARVTAGLLGLGWRSALLPRGA
jgi:hypothetical protein